MEDYKLFIKVLTAYHAKCIKNDLPINVIIPILVDVDSMLGELNYCEKEIDQRLILLCKRINTISGGSKNLAVFLMHSIVSIIDEKHNYFIKTFDEIIIASAISAKDLEEEANNEYWLTAWPPSRVASNPNLFIENIKLSKEIWMEESAIEEERLRRAAANKTSKSEPKKP